MKGEYIEQPPQQDNPFTKLHPFSSQTQTKQTEPANDGASIEVARRPRGRPPGSKNKPKPPVIITRDPTHPIMTPYLLELPPGTDIPETLSLFSRRRNLGLCVLSGSGTVSNVTIRQPPSSTVTFHGRFDILSISATFLPNQPVSSSSFNVPNNFSISLAGPQGQVVGGIVAGGLVTAGTVYIVASSFSNPSFHRLPGELEEERNGSGSGGEGQSPVVSVSGSKGGGESGHGGGGGLYSCSMGGGPDVIWAPTARPPPPPF